MEMKNYVKKKKKVIKYMRMKFGIYDVEEIKEIEERKMIKEREK